MYTCPNCGDPECDDCTPDPDRFAKPFGPCCDRVTVHFHIVEPRDPNLLPDDQDWDDSAEYRDNLTAEARSEGH